MKIGRLTVISLCEPRRGSTGQLVYFWLCRCDCGKEIEVNGGSLRAKKRQTRSCGCLLTDFNTTHGLSKHPLYGIWTGIVNRCYNENGQDYADYGGRGIRMSDAWRNSFPTFLADMGERPTRLHTIEREDNNGNYCAENCRWATRAEQNENTRQTRLITFDGVTLSLSKWAKRIGVNSLTLKSRLDDLGWSVERALTTPCRGRGYSSHGKSMQV